MGGIKLHFEEILMITHREKFNKLLFWVSSN